MNWLIYCTAYMYALYTHRMQIDRRVKKHRFLVVIFVNKVDVTQRRT